MYDLIIIGAGPAGITASVYAARKKMDFLVISGDIGGQTSWSGAIENYVGYQFITGPELVSKFEEHMSNYDVQLKSGEEVIELSKKGDIVIVRTDKGLYEARSAIIASGKFSRELGVPGEKEFKNKGLTYCATCDGPLFAKKDVAVIGGGNSALDASLQLMKIAKRVYLININPLLAGDAIMRDKVIGSSSVTILNNTQVTAIIGEKFVTGIKVAANHEPRTSSDERRATSDELIPVQGVFVEIGLIPNSKFASGIEKNDSGEIKINYHNETNISGIFAAGDVTDVPEKQIIIAAGEGSKAALGVFRYLSKRKA